MRICQLSQLGLLLTILMIGLNTGVGQADAPTAKDDLPPANALPHPPEGRKRSAKNTIHINFDNADIRQIIHLMSEITGKNFLVDEKVRGKVTVIAPKPITPEEAYHVFLSILDMHNLTTVPQGAITKIVPSQGVKAHALPTALHDQGQSASTGDAFITRLIPLEFADANEVRTLLSDLVSKESSLLAYGPTNTLILTEVAANISRLMTIVQALDVETSAVLFKVIPLQHALADEIAASLQLALEGLAHAAKLNGAKSTPGTRLGQSLVPSATGPRTPRAPTKIIPDSRTNSLVVIATPSDMAATHELITQLDVPTPEGQGQIHVHYLEHIDAEELAQVLTAQASDIARFTADRTTQKSIAQSGRKDDPAVNGSPVLTGATPTGITITAHKPTNSLVITSPPAAYALMKGIIKKLDIRRSQVLVESLIAEVTFDQAQALGVEWRLIDEPNGPQVFGSSLGAGEAGVLNTITADPLAAPPGLLLGVLRNAITINGQKLFNIPAILRAFQSTSDVNVLANPNLLAIDNEEAKIVIGEERPFLLATTEIPSGGVVATSRTFEFRDTGIILRVKPKISQNGTVRLNLFIELTTFVSEAETGAVTTTKRSTETSVIIDDAQTIIVGGLIQDNNNVIETQVPCLGNLPFFGWLFKQTSDRKRKTNLLIFITPHILATPDDAHRMTEHKRQQSEKPAEISEQLRKNRPPDNLERLLD